MEYESRVNERQIQTTEEKTDTSNALDALDANNRPIYNEEPMAEVQTTAEINIFATDHFLNVKSNEAKVKTDIDVTETINIELE
ncbi:hypothetical protein Tco_0419719, partial [Tanacetum coccineum]